MPALALMVILPLVEIGLFVTLGAWLGLGTTLLLVLASAFLGLSVIRRQGIVTMLEMRRALEMRRDPSRAMADGMLVVVAGVLLVVPGFLTSSVGLLLLVPGVRRALAAWAGRNMRMGGTVMGARDDGFGGERPSEPYTIDGDFFELDASKRPTHRPSGWTRH